MSDYATATPQPIAIGSRDVTRGTARVRRRLVLCSIAPKHSLDALELFAKTVGGIGLGGFTTSMALVVRALPCPSALEKQVFINALFFCYC